jgi:hypothetical protein
MKTKPATVELPDWFDPDRHHVAVFECTPRELSACLFWSLFAMGIAGAVAGFLLSRVITTI